MDIREITLDDLNDYIKLCEKLDQETKFMLYEPGERNSITCDYELQVKRIIERERETLLVAVEEGEFIGFVSVIGNNLRRIKHRASIVIGVIKEYHSKGIGKKLMAAAEDWARQMGIKRLELSVMSNNKQALWLYSIFDFNVEGIRRNAIIIDDVYVDEFYMSKMIN